MNHEVNPSAKLLDRTNKCKQKPNGQARDTCLEPTARFLTGLGQKPFNPRYLSAVCKMLSYAKPPLTFIRAKDLMIASFLGGGDINVDWKTVDSFGEEWKKFDHFSDHEIATIGNDYFDLVWDVLSDKTVALDVGCGSGRWAKYLSGRVKWVEAIDPSSAVVSAAAFLKSQRNVRVTQASVEHLPFPPESFDLVYSLGVLHHVPDTLSAIRRCYEQLKPGGWFLLYLYYQLENRSVVYSAIFGVSNVMRGIISQLAPGPKKVICDVLAVVVYWPLAQVSGFISLFSTGLADKFPLGYYRKTGFRVMRNDALDRFGTPLEKRFTRSEIGVMMETAGFHSIQFSPHPPYWHVIGQKK